MEREKPRSRKKKRLGVKFWAAVCGGIAVAAAATVTVLYIQTGKQYRTVFFPNTAINGIDASKKTVDEVKQLIASGIARYHFLCAAPLLDGQRISVSGLCNTGRYWPP